MRQYDTEAEKRAYAQGRADTVRAVEGSVRDAVRAAQAEAWDEGYAAGDRDARRVQQSYPDATDNPYREDTIEGGGA